MEQTKDIQVPAQSSAKCLTLNHADLLPKADPRSSFLVVDLESAGKSVSRNLVFFDVTHNLHLPVRPAIQVDPNQNGGQNTLTLQSDQLARDV